MVHTATKNSKFGIGELKNSYGIKFSFQVMSELGELFPYTAIYLLHELVSPMKTVILFIALLNKLCR